VTVENKGLNYPAHSSVDKSDLDDTSDLTREESAGL
jgi:hypothetical protein